MNAVDRIFLFLLIIALCAVCVVGLRERDQLKAEVASLERSLLAQEMKTISLSLNQVDHMKRDNDLVEKQNAINRQIMGMLNTIIEKGR